MEKLIYLNRSQDLRSLFGKYDQNLRIIEKELDVQVIPADKGLNLVGKKENIDKASELIDYLLSIIADGREVKQHDIVYAIHLTQPEQGIDFKRLAKEKIEVFSKGGLVTPKTKGQIEYVEAIKKYDIVFQAKGQDGP